MSTLHFRTRRNAALRFGLSILILVGFAFAAAIPRISEGLRLALAISGYVGFLFVFRDALRAWKSD